MMIGTDFTNIEWGPIEPKFCKNKIAAVKVYKGLVTFYRHSDYSYDKSYEPRQEWLDRICELLGDAVNYSHAEIELYPDGFMVAFGIEDNYE